LNNLFVEIGDEQSIENSLSTFSAKIKNIKYILEESDEKSLILIDEFGAGTDPVEGSALAISIIKKILLNKSLALMTTHYSALKHFASQEKFVENASMEFDNENLMPTYKLKVGIPGSSKALEISQRLGISDDVISTAKEYLDKDFLDFQKLNKKLEIELKNYEVRSLELDKLQKEILEKENLFKENLEKVEAERLEVKRIFNSQESEFLKESRKEFENLVKELKTSNASKDVIKKGKNYLDNLTEKVRDEFNEELHEETEDNYSFKKGDRVLVVSKGHKGTVIDITNNENEFLVQVGLIKLNILSSDLKPVESNNSYKRVNKVNFSVDAALSQRTIDLRGLRYTDAEKRIEKFIDESLVNHVSTVRIIHGKGSGALRNCIHDFLKVSPYVTDYYYEKGAEDKSTNFGITIATLS